MQGVAEVDNPTCPERPLQAAEFLGAEISRAKLADAGDNLTDQLIKYMQRLQVPNGLSVVGYTSPCLRFFAPKTREKPLKPA